MYIKGIEYICNYLMRIYKIYAGIGRYAHRITTREDVYAGLVNSSMICFMNLETGHLEITNIRLCYNTTDVINVDKCLIELNHDTHKFERMFIEMEDGLGLREVVDETNETVEEAATLIKVHGPCPAYIPITASTYVHANY